jgi:vacuolar protein sorting-associated protein 45
MVAMVYSMNDILAKEVYLVESLDASHESLGHMKAICLVRPTADTIRELVRHLKEPKFLEYHIFFTNIVPQDLLRKLADADHLSVVKQVQEAYADVYAVNPDVFTLNLGGTLALSRPKDAYSHADETNLKRCASALLSVLLSFKVKPYVRYLASSESAAYVAREVAGTMGGERELFTFQRTGGAPLLIVMDRREDPVTPLLTQWTYQAMVHELLPGGIKNNRVDLKHVKGVSKDLE